MNTFTHNKIEYKICVVTNKNYKKFSHVLERLLICDPSYISNVLENANYESIQDDKYTIGFFLLDDKNVLCSMVVDTMCRHGGDVMSKYIDINHAIEISLLCANYLHHVPGLTLFFTSYIINEIIPSLKEDVNYVFLYVAKGDANQRALSFYKKVGFKEIDIVGKIDKNIKIMIYDLSNK